MELQVGVKAILKNKEGKYLLVKRSNKKYPEVGAIWDIPGGRIEKGSKLMDNLRREILEEVGLELKEEPKLIFAQDILKSDKHVVRLTYSGVIEGEPKISDEDNTEFGWFTLEEIKTLKNLDIYLKEVVEKISSSFAITSVKALIMNNGKFLVLKKNIHIRHDRWDIPGGKVQYGEDPYNALKREVMEETSLEITIEKSLGVWHYLRLNENDQVVCHMFLCTTKSNNVDISKNKEEGFPVLEYKWVTKEEFLDMPANERLKKFISEKL